MRNRLLQLLADNRKATARRVEPIVVAKADDATEVELFIYDAIVSTEDEAEWWGGIAPQTFVKALRALGPEVAVIHVRVNSPGGSIFAARAIEQALREHKARVVVHVDGLAASAASSIAMAGDEIIMAQGAMMMIHKGWTFAVGNADEMRKCGELLDKCDGTLVQTYADRTGQSPEQLLEWMAAETWFTAQEAVDNGFADSIAESSPKAEGSWNLSAYLKPPKAEAKPVPPAPALASEEHRDRQRQRARVAGLARIE